MFLITDKLDKSQIKYDLMKDEKCVLAEHENVECVVKKNNTNRLIYIILIGLTFTIATWLMLTSNRFYYNKQYEAETSILTNAFNAVNETNAILKKVGESVSIISEYNVENALKYVEAIQELLKEQTRYAVQKINRIVTEKIREIENELTSFDYVITEASEGIVDYTLQDMKKLRESISSTSNATYRTDFENIYSGVEERIGSAFADLDSMYTFYGSYMSDIIDRKVQNATDRISMIVNSNRKSCECTIKEKVNFCYTVSAQNAKIASQLEALVKVFAIVNNTTDILDTLEPVLLKDSDRYSCSLITEARTVLNKALVKSESVLESVLMDDNCFLGSAVQRAAYEGHQKIKDFILNSFETSIQSLAKNLNVTTGNFKVVQEKHRKEVEQDVNEALNAMADEIRVKAKDLSSSTALDEYVQKTSFSDVRLWMDTKFQNVTDVINPLFEKRQQEIAQGLKYTLQYIVFQQIPFMSSLSVQNYLPTDVCPLSTDYQKFITITLDQYLDPTAKNVAAQLTMSNDFSRETETAQLVQDEIDDEDGDSKNNNNNNNNDDDDNNNSNSNGQRSEQLVTEKSMRFAQNLPANAIAQAIKNVLMDDFANQNSINEQPTMEIIITQIEEQDPIKEDQNE